MDTLTSPESATLSADHQSIGEELRRLQTLDLYGLQVRWRRVFGRSAPQHLSRSLILRILAYKIQADAFGDLDRATVRLLDQIAREAAKARATGEKATMTIVPPVEENRCLKPETVLAREHDGEMQRVIVLAQGYEWKGLAFKSLSEVARAVTGVRWNGPRFFNLRPGKGRVARPEEEVQP